MKRLCLFLMLWAIPLCAGDTPPVVAPGIRLPALPAAAVATPPAVEPEPVSPSAPTIHKLTNDNLYVFDSDVDVIVTSSPLGLVDVKSEDGPLRIRGRFVDNANISTRTFKGKRVFIVEPVKSGRVELIVIPNTAKVESDLIRRTIDVDTGVAPEPKPPGPKPPDPIPVPTKELRVLFVYESGANLSRNELNVLNSLEVKKYLETHCVKDGPTYGYRFWDKDIDATKDLPVWRDIWTATKPSITKLPVVVIFSGAEGKHYPLPATEKELLDLLTKYGGK